MYSGYGGGCLQGSHGSPTLTTQQVPLNRKRRYPVVIHVLVQIHRRIKKNIPVRGIQTTPRTNHISSRRQQAKSVRRSSTTKTHEISKSKNESQLQSTCRIQADSFIQNSKTPDESKHDIAEIVSRECGRALKAWLEPYEVSAIDRKGSVEAVRQGM